MTLDSRARARIARGWLNSSLDQPAYAAMHGISSRTLRDWVCRYGGGRRPHAQLRAAIVASIEQLQNVLAALDAEAAAGSAPMPEDNRESFEVVERHSVSAGVAARLDVTEVARPAGPMALSTPAEGAAPAGGVLPLLSAGADGAASQQGRVPPRGNEASTVLDLKALRERAADRRAASGTRKRNPFLDWDDV